MRRWLKVVGVLTLAAAWLPMAIPPAAHADTPVVSATFNATGAEQTFAVPPGVRKVHVIVTGGHGGTNGTAVGGNADTIIADLPVAPGSNLYVEVGANGHNNADTAVFNGGAKGGGAGGSDIRTVPRCTPDCDASLGSRLVIAGGGGGGGASGFGVSTFAGGKGGDAGNPGLDGNGSDSFKPGGKGGKEATATDPGAGGEAGATGVAGSPGDRGSGGDSVGGGDVNGGGGGGGGGLYGGGGGASGNGYMSAPDTLGGITGGGGGGGGSSFVTPLATFSLTTVDSTGTPSVVITYNLVETTLSATPVLVKLSPLGVFIGSLNATLRRADTGDPIAGQLIRFSSGGKTLCNAVTAGNGTATCSGLTFTLSALLSLGYSASYAGGGGTAYLPSQASAPILM